MVTHGKKLLLLVAAATLLGGCTAAGRRSISVPPEMLKPKDKPREKASETSMYVVRMSEGGRVWEVSLPESSGGYEVRVPLAGPIPEQLTRADQELLADTAATSAGLGTVTPASATVAPAGKPQVDARAAGARKSYLGTLAKVNELYTARKFELALIEVSALEQQYPEDARLWSMKGSLYLKLGRHKLARESWEKALSLNPNDTFLAEALRELAARQE